MQTSPKRQKIRQTIPVIRANICSIMNEGKSKFRIDKLHTRQPTRKTAWVELQDRYVERMDKYNSLGVMGWFTIDSDSLGIVMSFLYPARANMDWFKLMSLKGEWGKIACLRTKMRATVHHHFVKALKIFSPVHEPVHLRDLRDAVALQPKNIEQLSKNCAILQTELIRVERRSFDAQPEDLDYFELQDFDGISWLNLCCLGPSDPNSPKWDRHYEECLPPKQKAERVNIVQAETERESRRRRIMNTIQNKCRQIGITADDIKKSNNNRIINRLDRWESSRVIKFAVMLLVKNVAMVELMKLSKELARVVEAENSLNLVLRRKSTSPSFEEVDIQGLCIDVYRHLEKEIASKGEANFNPAKASMQLHSYNLATMHVKKHIRTINGQIDACVLELKSPPKKDEHAAAAHEKFLKKNTCACKMLLSVLCTASKCAECCNRGCSFHRGI